jgi:hypothetical protein
MMGDNVQKYTSLQQSMDEFEKLEQQCDEDF